MRSLAAFALLVACGETPETAAGSPAPLPADVTAGHYDRAFLVDLCVDEQASRILDGGELENERRRVGVFCGPEATEDTFRYAGWFSGAEKPYKAKDRERAIREVRAENRKIDRARATPAPDEFYASPDPEDGCTSHGLKDMRRWAKDPSSVRGDFDGDGRGDRFVIYATESGSFGDDVRLRMELASGIVADRPTDDWQSPWDHSAFGTADLNRDGRDEVWALMHGDGQEFAGLLVFEDCDPTEVLIHREGRVDDTFHAGLHGGPPPFESAGLECADIGGNGSMEVVQTYRQEAWTHDEGSPDDFANPPSSPEDWHYTAYRFDGTQMRMVRKDEGTGAPHGPGGLTWKSGFDDRCFAGGQPRSSGGS